MNVEVRQWLDNPYLTRELRGRMRGSRAYWVMGLYLLVLSGLVCLVYATAWTQNTEVSSATFLPQLSGMLFAGICAVQFALVVLVGTATTLGAVTVEREQDTLDVLLNAPMPLSRLVWGKLLGAWSFIGLLLAASLPLTGICFILGGISPGEVLAGYTLLAILGVMSSSVAIAASSACRHTVASAVTAYGLVAVLAGALLFCGLSADGRIQNAGDLDRTIVASILQISSLVTPFSLNTQPTIWTDGAHLFRFTMPPGTVPVLGCILFTLVLGSATAARLRTDSGVQTTAVRLLIMVSLAFCTLVSCGIWLAMVQVTRAGSFAFFWHPVRALFLPACLLTIIGPLTATSSVCPDLVHFSVSRMLRASAPAGLVRARVLSAPVWLAGAWLLCIAVYLLAFALSGHGAMLVTGDPGNGVKLQGGTSGLTELLHVTVVVGAGQVGVALLGMLLSRLIANRWYACLALYALLIATVGVGVPAGHIGIGNRTSPDPLSTLQYLYVPMSVLQEGDTAVGFWYGRTLIFGHAPFWVVGSLLYLAIGAGSVLFLVLFANRDSVRRAVVRISHQARTE